MKTVKFRFVEKSYQKFTKEEDVEYCLQVKTVFGWKYFKETIGTSTVNEIPIRVPKTFDSKKKAFKFLIDSQTAKISLIKFIEYPTYKVINNR